jgi:SM-20-related protein
VTAGEGTIRILDGALTPELGERAAAIVAQPRWYFGNSSGHGDEPAFWKMDLDGEPHIDAVWVALRRRCEEQIGASLRVLRQYANGHTYGLGGRTHVDDTGPGRFTLLYYPMRAWEPAWGGETVFHQPNGEIALSVLPRPNRALLFDARIPHEGRAPSRDFGGLRVTIAFKLTVTEAPP